MTCAKAEDRLKCLHERHAELKQMVARLQQERSIVQMHRLRNLKKQKLRIKDEICQLQAELAKVA